MDFIGYISDKNREQIMCDHLGEENFSLISDKLNAYFNTLVTELDESKLSFIELVSHLSKRASKEYIQSLPCYENNHREILVVTDENIKKCVSSIRKLTEVGFDTEAEPTFKKGQPHNVISLIQICSMDICYIFKMNEISEKNHKYIARVVNDHRIKKIGVGLNGDITRLEDDYGFVLAGVISIDEVFKKLGSKEIVGAKQMVAIVLQQQLKKSKNISRSNWASELLTQRQLQYASDDVFAALDVFIGLQHLLKEYSGLLSKRVIKLLLL